MNALVLAAALAVAPAQASDFDALFGLTPGDAIAQFHKQQREEEERKARQRSWDLFWGRIVELRYPEQCTFAAVARRMGVALKPELERPAVYYQSWTELYDFQSAYHWENGQTVDRLFNVLLPRSNAIYLIDKSDFYRRGRSIDDSLALLHAIYFQYHYRYNSDKKSFESMGEDVQIKAIEVQNWYRSEFRRKSPCQTR